MSSQPVESVEEDYQPNSSSAVEVGAILAPSTPPRPSLVDTPPESVTRPLAYREPSLAPPFTVSDFYNATPRSSPMPRARMPIDARYDNITAGLGAVRIGSSLAAEEQGETRDRDDLTPPFIVPVREEPLPQAPFYDGKLHRAIRKAQTMMTNIAEQLAVLELARDPQSRLFALRQQALASQEFESDAVRIIGIVGESAAGMFSLVPLTLS